LKKVNRMKFYYWEPDPERSKSYGHVAIELENGTYISFWPDVKHFRATREGNRITGIKSMCFPSFKDEVQKLLTDEEKKEREKYQWKLLYPDKIIPIMSMNEMAIEEWFVNFKSTDPKWTLLTQSCSNVIHEALCKGSTLFDQTQVVEGFITTPKAVYQTVKKGFLQGKKASIKLGSKCKAKP